MTACMTSWDPPTPPLSLASLARVGVGLPLAYQPANLDLRGGSVLWGGGVATGLWGWWGGVSLVLV
jgi:hypothetical protein